MLMNGIGEIAKQLGNRSHRNLQKELESLHLATAEKPGPQTPVNMVRDGVKQQAERSSDDVILERNEED